MLTPRMYLAIFVLCCLTLSSSMVYARHRHTGQESKTPRVLHHESLRDLRFEAASATSRTTTDPPELWTLSFDAFHRRFELLLESNVQLIEHLPTAQRARLHTHHHLYRGRIAGVEGSWVRLTRTDTRFSGLVWDGVELYAIEPTETMRGSRQRSTDGLAMYRLSDVVSTGTCALDPHAQTIQNFGALGQELQARAHALPLGTQQLDVAVIGDVLFTQNTSDPEGLVIALFNAVDGIYADQVGISLNVASIQLLQNNGTLTSNDASTLLNQLASLSASPSVNNPGLIHLLTGRDLLGNTIGTSFLNVLCNDNFGVGLSQIPIGSMALTTTLIAHEIGHNFGAPHDNQGGSVCASTPGGFLMSPSIQISDTFSQCSLDHMQPEITQASCLRDLSSVDVRVSIPTNPALASLNTPFDYHIEIRNDGTDPAENVSAVLTIPAAFTIQSATANVGSCSVTGAEQVTCTFGSITGGEDRTITLQLEATQIGTFLSSVTVDASNDGDVNNNAAEGTMNVLGGGTTVFSASFSTGPEGFTFIPDAFRGTSAPVFAAGNFVPTGGLSGGGLQILLGGVNNDDILGMSGGWQRTFTLSTASRVTLSFRYNMTQASSYESDEFSEALLAIDGQLISSTSNGFLVRLTGDGNEGPPLTTGWVSVEHDLGVLPAGLHTVTLGGFNNKKTFNDETTDIRLDDVILQATPEAVSPPPASTGNLLEAHFDTSADGFAYVGDPFRGTNAPDYASGQHVAAGGFSDGALLVLLGGLNNDDIFGMSGGWTRTFTLASTQALTLSFRYKLTQTATYESNEFSEALLAFDGAFLSGTGNDFLARISGDNGSAPSTDWVLVTIDLGLVSAGEHRITLGGFNNKKTFNDEATEILIDNVIVQPHTPGT